MTAVYKDGFCDSSLCNWGFVAAVCAIGVLWQQFVRMDFVTADCRSELCGSRL